MICYLRAWNTIEWSRFVFYIRVKVSLKFYDNEWKTNLHGLHFYVHRQDKTSLLTSNIRKNLDSLPKIWPRRKRIVVPFHKVLVNLLFSLGICRKSVEYPQPPRSNLESLHLVQDGQKDVCDTKIVRRKHFITFGCRCLKKYQMLENCIAEMLVMLADN
jgi:hypothetical protein